MTYRDSSFTYIHIDNPNQVLYMEKWQDEPIPLDDIDTQGLFDATATLFPQFLLEEEEDVGIPINSSTFGAKAYKNRSLLKEKVWTDLGIYEKFLNESSSLHKQADNTILKSIHTKSPNDFTPLDESGRLALNDFLSNGYATENAINQMLAPSDITSNSINNGDISITSTSDYLGPANNTFNYRSGSTSGPSANPLPIQSYPTPQKQQQGHSSFSQMPSQIHSQQHVHTQQNNSFFSVQTPRIGRTRQPSSENLQTPITRIVR